MTRAPVTSPSSINHAAALCGLLVLSSALACANANPGRQRGEPARTSAPPAARTAPVQLSADAGAEATVQRCLANAQGSVARYTDNEAFAAVDAADANRVIVVWQTQSGSGSVIQWVRSTDGGRTWTPPRAAPINACAGGPVAGATHASDPWAAFGPDGRAYISAIAWKPDPEGDADLVSALIVAASPDGGDTWNPPVAAAIAPSPGVAHDNLAITADPTRPGTVYAATTRAEIVAGASYFGRLGFTRSDDGGRTWTPIRAITAAVNQERVGAPQIVVDPRSGKLYAAYHRSRGGERVIGVMTSDDRGETWSAERVAAPHVRGLRAQHPVSGRRFVLATDIIQAVVSPASGRLLIAYADARRDPGGRHDVSITWSADGSRWSEPMVLSDAASGHAWLPAVAVDANGEIGVSYFSAHFAAGGPAEARARVMLHRLRDTRDGLEPIASATIDEAALEWPGDYQGLAVVRGGFLAVYGRESDIVATLAPIR